MSRTHVLEREQRLALPLAQVFAFFEAPANLEKLTPRELRFEILTPPPLVMKKGAIIDYKLRLFGVPFRWRTLIEDHEPGVRFVDLQTRGPYRSWRHLHEFRADGPGATIVRDRVEYALPLGVLGGVAHALFVRRQVEGIFAYRAKVLPTLLPGA